MFGSHHPLWVSTVTLGTLMLKRKFLKGCEHTVQRNGLSRLREWKEKEDEFRLRTIISTFPNLYFCDKTDSGNIEVLFKN